MWNWELAAWEGHLSPGDPDGFVLEAAWVPLDEAVDPWRESAGSL